MSLTAIAETYAYSGLYVLTVGTSAVGELESGTYTHTMNVDEMTNLSDGGGYSDVKTYEKVDHDVTISWKNGTEAPVFTVGDIYLFVADGGAGNPYFSHNARLVSESAPIYGVKSGVKVAYKFTSQGAITRTRPA